MFKLEAPKYWAKGISVIPLRPKAKVPALNAWSQYATQLPSPEQQAQWLDAFEDGNIGLALGPQSGIVALDIDSVDPRVQGVLDKVMPHSPWKRVGKKGAVFAFRYGGERTFRIKDENNGTIMELLSKGTQVVLPPSIHPDTGLPYQANADLLSVVDKLPGLPADFEQQLRQALIDAGFKLSVRGSARVADWVPAGGRDSAMTSNAGILARAVIRGERTLLEAMNEMEAWVLTYTEKVIGDPLDPDKAKKKVAEFVRRDVMEAGHRLPHDWSDGMSSEELVQWEDFFGGDVEEWPTSTYIMEVGKLFEEIPAEDVAGRTEAVDKILLRLAKSEHISELDRGVILRQIFIASGRQLQVSQLKARLKELTGSAGIVGDNHTEVAEALKVELERGGDLRFFAGSFYRWAGAHWELLEEHIVLSTLAKEFGHLPAAKRFNDHRGVVAVLQRICTKPLRTEEVDGVNFANGFLTTDMQLLDHDPRFGATYVLPYRYLGDDARVPLKFLGLLDRCWGKEEDFDDRVQALREALASTLFGVTTKYARAFCLYGLAHTGKSTILDVMCGLVPPGSVSRVLPTDWADKFMPAQMAGKLVNVGGDLNENQVIQGSAFKMIVSGEEIQAQHKNAPIFSFSPRCAHWFATNHLPRTRDSSSGFTRRWLFWDFRHKVTLDEKNVNLAADITAEEREDIVAWALPAIEDLMRRGDYTLPKCHKQKELEVATANNTARSFMHSTRIAFEPGAKLEERLLYGTYEIYVRNDLRQTPTAVRRFRALMEELSPEYGFMMNPDGSYQGIKLTKQRVQV